MALNPPPCPPGSHVFEPDSNVCRRCGHAVQAFHDDPPDAAPVTPRERPPRGKP